MSTIEEALAAIDMAAAMENEKIELQKVKQLVDIRKYTAQADKIKKNDEDIGRAKSAKFGELSQKDIDKLRKDNSDYMEAAKNSMVFINSAFNGIVPYFRKNIIFIGANTGNGKSLAAANIAFSTMSQINPETNKPRRVLVITNEEKPEDVYNRVTCLIKGWTYTNHSEFTEEQRATLDEFIPILAKDGRLTVVADDYNGASGLTTSIEGIKTIFDNLLRDGEYYDAIILDYYQNVKESKLDSTMDEYKVQAKLSALLDQYKNIYPAPIVVMAQVNPIEKDKKPFSLRIQGRKIILNVSTIAIEIIADRENLRTEWLIHKSRFTDACGKSFYTGYDRGKFVEYTDAFQGNVLVFRTKQLEQNHSVADLAEKTNKME